MRLCLKCGAVQGSPQCCEQRSSEPPAPCSAAFAGCIVGFSLEGRRLAVVPNPELGDRLFKLRGRDWKPDGISGGVCGVFFTVKFETALPTAAEVEAVRNTITDELNRPQNADFRDPAL